MEALSWDMVTRKRLAWQSTNQVAGWCRIHEPSYMLEGNLQPLEVGMCGSIEPLLSIPGEVAIRLEDHSYMSE